MIKWIRDTQTFSLMEPQQQQQQQQSLFVPQKLYSVDINTRKKKNYKGKEHSHLEIAKLIELSGLAKQKKFNFHCIIYSSAGVLHVL